MCKIRFIVETVSSETDSNGNRYHFAMITSTETGKHLKLLADGQRNAPALVLRAIGGRDWDAIHATECTIPKRQWQHASKGGLYEHNVNADMILALELP